MQPIRIVLLTASLVTLALSGCADTPVDPGPVEPETCIVTRPGDFSCEAAAQNRTDAAHLHDYWGGKDRLVVMEELVEIGTFGILSDGAFWLRPPGDAVIPQGTAQVEVTLTWDEYEPAIYDDPRLYVTTASQRDPVLVGPVEQGKPLAVQTTNEDNDLPHQRLSAWQFILAIRAAEPGAIAYFQADLNIRVEAIRGLDIPLYPGHPDPWQGRTEIPLLDYRSEGFAAADGQAIGPAGVGRVCANGCPFLIGPDAGALVPGDAVVEVVLVDENTPASRLGLMYHGADTRELTAAEPVEETDTTRTYRIPVDGNGDGPYAKLSLWEFMAFIDGDVQDRAYAGSYTLTAKALRATD